MQQNFNPDEDLVVFFTQPPFTPVRYRHVKRGTCYTVISQGQFHLNEISEEGSLHEFMHNGQKVDCMFQFSGGVQQNSRYGGPITIYLGDDGKYWMRPDFEFNDGRFEKVEA